MRPPARTLLFAVGAWHRRAVHRRDLGLPGFGGAAPLRRPRRPPRRPAGHPNAVASVTFDQRAFDTLGEELILLSAALAAVVLLRAAGREREDGGGSHRHGPAEVSDALRVTGYLLLPLTLLVGVYIVAHGHQSPAADSRAASSSAPPSTCSTSPSDYPALRLRPIPLLESAEALAAAAFVLLALAAAGQAATGRVPALNAAVGAEVGCALVLLIGKFFDRALLVHDTGGPESGRPEEGP